MQALDELMACAANEIADVVVLAEQSHTTGARGGVHCALRNLFKIEAPSNALTDVPLQIQQTASQ